MLKAIGALAVGVLLGNVQFSALSLSEWLTSISFNLGLLLVLLSLSMLLSRVSVNLGIAFAFVSIAVAVFLLWTYPGRLWLHTTFAI